MRRSVRSRPSAPGSPETDPGGLLEPIWTAEPGGWLEGAIVEEARSLLGAGGAALFRWNEAEQALLVIHQLPAHPVLNSARDGDWLMEQVFKTGEPGVLHESNLFLKLTNGPDARLDYYAVAVPLMAGARRLGCLLVWAPGIHGVQEADIAQLATYGKLAGGLLDRAWQAPYHLPEDGSTGAVRTPMAGVGTIDGPISLASSAIASVTTLVGSDCAALLWWDPETSHLRSFVGGAGRRDIVPFTCPPDSPSATAFALSRSLSIHDYEEHSPELPPSLGRGIHTMAAVPILLRGRALGVLSAYRSSSSVFTTGDLDRLHLMAMMLAPALEGSIQDTAMVERQELMEMILANAPLVCGILNREGVVTVGGGAGLELIGVSPDFFIGSSVFDLYSHNPELLEGVRRALDGSSNRLEMTSSVSSHSWEVCLDPIHDMDGSIKGASMILIDLTERQLAQQAQKESAAKSQFLATMSHELRTPLNSILGFSELLQRGVLDERQNRYLTNISTSGRHLLSLINDLLDMAKIQAGQIEVTLHPVDLTVIVHEAMEIMSPLARRAALDLSSRIPAKTVVQADPRRLHQVIVNLLSNAVKFTRAGGQIKVTARHSGDCVLIRVSDTGIGIAPEDRDRVFEEFTQVGSGTTREHHGTGLGLPVSRRLTELMGGTLTLAGGSHGRGSVFTIRLPIADSIAR